MFHYPEKSTQQLTWSQELQAVWRNCDVPEQPIVIVDNKHDLDAVFGFQMRTNFVLKTFAELAAEQTTPPPYALKSQKLKSTAQFQPQKPYQPPYAFFDLDPQRSITEKAERAHAMFEQLRLNAIGIIAVEEPFSVDNEIAAISILQKDCKSFGYEAVQLSALTQPVHAENGEPVGETRYLLVVKPQTIIRSSNANTLDTSTVKTFSSKANRL